MNIKTECKSKETVIRSRYESMNEIKLRMKMELKIENN